MHWPFRNGLFSVIISDNWHVTFNIWFTYDNRQKSVANDYISIIFTVTNVCKNRPQLRMRLIKFCLPNKFFFYLYYPRTGFWVSQIIHDPCHKIKIYYIIYMLIQNKLTIIVLLFGKQFDLFYFVKLIRSHTACLNMSI